MTPAAIITPASHVAPVATVARRDDLFIAALILLWLLATAWARPLMLPDEGRYVGVAWEMLRSGDWLTPTLNGLPYFHKPPLFYWITAGSMSLFGLNEWAARAAPILGAWLGAFALYLFTRRWWGKRAAHLALCVLMVQPLFYIGGQFANLDMLVAGCITATILLLAHAALCIEVGLPYRRALAAAFAMAALGVLAKGLIGFVLPALVIGAWLALRRRWHVLASLMWWPGALIFVLVAAPWFLAMQMRFADFSNYFFVVQHFHRFAAGGFNNVQPFWYYPAVLLLFSLPCLPWLARRRGRGAQRDAERDSVRLLMVLWAATVVLFFSLPQSKLLGYVLPAVPPLALLMADGFLSLGAPSQRARRLWQVSVGVSAALSIGAVAALAVYPKPSSRTLAAALASQRGSDEPVYMLGRYYFDLPFYARMRAPVGVVDDWSSPDIAKRDNWRKELADAGTFAPALARKALLAPASLPAALCAGPVSWVLGADTAAAAYPFLSAGVAMRRVGDTTLWRIDHGQPAMASALRCEGTPNDGSANK